MVKFSVSSCARLTDSFSDRARRLARSSPLSPLPSRDFIESISLRRELTRLPFVFLETLSLRFWSSREFRAASRLLTKVVIGDSGRDGLTLSLGSGFAAKSQH